MKKKRRKLSARTKLKNQLKELVKIYVRTRDASICQKCEKMVSGTNRHTSHVYSKGAFPRLEFDPENLKVLCYYCHRRWWHNNPIQATKWFEEKFPLRAEYLLEASQNQNKLTESELEEMIEEIIDKTVGLGVEADR